MKTSPLALAVILVLCITHTVFGSWMLIPLEKLVKDNPLIVKGKITSIKHADAPDNPREFKCDTAYITVDKVLKNTLTNKTIKVGDQIPLSMPSINNKMMMSTDIRYKKGQEGIWILELRKNSFWATYPMDLQPNSNEKKITELILKTGNQGGKPVNGLQLTLSADKQDLSISKLLHLGKRGAHDPLFNTEKTNLSLTFKNVSKKSIRLNTYDIVWTSLSLTIKGPDEKSVKAKNIANLTDRAMAMAGKKDFPEIKPGESYTLKDKIIFPDSSIGGLRYYLLKPGTYQLSISCISKNNIFTQTKEVKKLQAESWKGKLTSNEMTLNYKLKTDKPEKQKKIKDIF